MHYIFGHVKTYVFYVTKKRHMCTAWRETKNETPFMKGCYAMELNLNYLNTSNQGIIANRRTLWESHQFKTYVQRKPQLGSLLFIHIERHILHSSISYSKQDHNCSCDFMLIYILKLLPSHYPHSLIIL